MRIHIRSWYVYPIRGSCEGFILEGIAKREILFYKCANGWRISRKPRKSAGARKRSLRLRSGRLYCLDRRSVSGADKGNSEADATR